MELICHDVGIVQIAKSYYLVGQKILLLSLKFGVYGFLRAVGQILFLSWGNNIFYLSLPSRQVAGMGCKPLHANL